MARRAHSDRVRHGNYTPAKANGQFVCMDCGDPVPRFTYGGRTVRPRLRCDLCGRINHYYRAYLSGKGLAGLAVKRAIQNGELRSARECSCVDCGRPAWCYDHRDYNEPLRVEPVCHSCNVMRGPAIPFNPLLVGLLLLARAA